METIQGWRKTVGRLAGLAASAGILGGLVIGLGGCDRLRPHPAEQYVYVTAKQAVLVDRPAAVSNRVATAENGEKLIVLERGRRVLKVKTPQGQVGWVKEMLTAGPDVAEQFEAMGKEHAKDPVVAKAATLNEVYLHAAPGLWTARFYLLNEGDKLDLLERATVEKKTAAEVAAEKAAAKREQEKATAADKAGDKPGDKSGDKAGDKSADKDEDKDPEKALAAEDVPVTGAAVVAPPPVMQDWWLVRDAKGQTGWIYSRLIDVSAPDTLQRYAEGARTVGAYILGYADDPDSGVLDNGNTVTQIPEYVEVLSPYKAGLPYDFDQVRVFTWNVKKHRYETAFREKNIAGYLPVTMGTSAEPYSKAQNAAEKLPSFTYHVLAGDAPMPVPDPETGLMKPAKLVAKTYRLEGNMVRRIVEPGNVPEEAHLVPVPEKKAKVRATRAAKKPARVGKKKR
jgi:hypothetical protein